METQVRGIDDAASGRRGSDNRAGGGGGVEVLEVAVAACLARDVVQQVAEIEGAAGAVEDNLVDFGTAIDEVARRHRRLEDEYVVVGAEADGVVGGQRAGDVIAAGAGADDVDAAVERDGVVAAVRSGTLGAGAEGDDVVAGAGGDGQGIVEGTGIHRHRIGGAGRRGIHRGQAGGLGKHGQRHALRRAGGIEELQGFDAADVGEVGIRQGGRRIADAQGVVVGIAVEVDRVGADNGIGGYDHVVAVAGIHDLVEMPHRDGVVAGGTRDGQGIVVVGDESGARGRQGDELEVDDRRGASHVGAGVGDVQRIVQTRAAVDGGD